MPLSIWTTRFGARAGRVARPHPHAGAGLRVRQGRDRGPSPRSVAGAGCAWRSSRRGARRPIQSQLLGAYNASNLLGVLGVLLAAGVELEAGVRGARPTLEPPAGRLQMIRLPGRPLVVVDYAHTPDALEKVLETLRAVGGPRARSCGACSAAAAIAIPASGRSWAKSSRGWRTRRSSPATTRAARDPRSIIDAMVAGAHPNYHVEEDRAAAIYRAVREAGPEDVVLIAGKGHETLPGDRRAAPALQRRRGGARSAAAAGLTRCWTSTPRPYEIGAGRRGPGASFDGVTTDSRQVSHGDLFVALKGDRFDGHDSSIRRWSWAPSPPWCREPSTGQQPHARLIIVDDTRLGAGPAGGALARPLPDPAGRGHRQQRQDHA